MKDTSKEKASPQSVELKNKVAELETAIVELKLESESLKRNEKNLVSLLKSMEDIVFLLGLDGTFNRFFNEATGRGPFSPAKKYLGKHFRDVLPAATADLMQKTLNAVETYGKTQQLSYSMILNQNEQWFSLSISPFRSKASDYFGYVCIVKNITYQKMKEDKLLETEERYRAVIMQNTECIFLADIDARVILEANQAMGRMLGYSQEELPGLSLSDFMDIEEADLFDSMNKVLRERNFFIAEHKFRRKDGSAIDVEIRVNEISFQDKKIYCVTARDIASRKLAEEQLTYTATHDPLTGMVNRLLLYERLEMQLAIARRLNSMFALLYIDIDKFKEINDTLGHNVGDQLLRAVGVRLKSHLRRQGDTLARMGGDEYMFILSEIAVSEDAERIAGKILQSLRLPFILDGINHHISASIGISIYPEDGSNNDVLIKAADLAMYQVKSGGRNNFRRFSPDMGKQKFES